MARVHDQGIEDFLGSPCTLSGASDPTWGDWISGVLWSLYEDGDMFSGKRPNCNSCWDWELEQAMVFVDPKVGNLDAYRKYLEARDGDDYELAEELEQQVCDATDRGRARETWAKVCRYIVAPRYKEFS